MKIKFKAIGLEFDAEVDYTPGTPDHVSGPPDSWAQGDDPELEVTKLTCNYDDAMFLLDSTVAELIMDAAYEAAEVELTRGCF